MYTSVIAPLQLCVCTHCHERARLRWTECCGKITFWWPEWLSNISVVTGTLFLQSCWISAWPVGKSNAWVSFQWVYLKMYQALNKLYNHSSQTDASANVYFYVLKKPISSILSGIVMNPEFDTFRREKQCKLLCVYLQCSYSGPCTAVSLFVTPSRFDICRGNDRTGAISQIIGSLLGQETLQLTITSQVRLVRRWA